MTENLLASAQVDIDATPTRVWQALTDPAEIEKYMFGSAVETDWQPGSPIVWKGEYEGKQFVDKGEIVEVTPQQRLVLTHFSPMSGQEDRPENYHTLTYELAANGGSTTVLLTQDHNASADEVRHSSENWGAMLAGLKDVVEQGAT